MYIYILLDIHIYIYIHRKIDHICAADMIVFFSVRGWGYDAIQPEVTEEAHG